MFGLAKKRPELEAKAEAATNSGNVSAAEKVFKEAIGFIIAEADDGTLEIDRATLKALKVIQFDHQNGKILIGSTSISSKVLITGGSKGATGTTTIGGNTNLKSAGTEIKVGQDALIKMTGNAKITQN